MPVSDVFSQYAQPVRSIADFSNALNQQALVQQQLQIGHANMLAKQQEIADNLAVGNAFKASGGDPTAVRQALLQGGHVKALTDYDKSQADLLKTKSDADLSTAHAADFRATTAGKVLTTAKELLPQVQNPQQAGQWVDALYSNPATAEAMKALGTPEEAKARIPTDPAGLQEWVKKNSMGMDKYIADQTSRANNAATNATHVQTTKMTNDTSRANNASTNATSRSNNAATIAKDYKVAGLDMQGNFTGGSGAMDGIIDGIGKNLIPESTALGRIPPGMKAQVMSEVMKRYPDYDPTNYATRAAANKAFTTGKEAASLRSIGTANKHLDMVGGMIDALGNGDVQALNKIGRLYSVQTGSPAPTNFDAAKEIVGQEVVKAIVAGGGGVAERAEAAAALSKAKSPAQLKGVVQTYRTIMSAQQESLIQQRDAAGLPRSTLPNYTEGSGSGLPSGWKIEKVGK